MGPIYGCTSMLWMSLPLSRVNWGMILIPHKECCNFCMSNFKQLLSPFSAACQLKAFSFGHKLLEWSVWPKSTGCLYWSLLRSPQYAVSNNWSLDSKFKHCLDPGSNYLCSGFINESDSPCHSSDLYLVCNGNLWSIGYMPGWCRPDFNLPV